MSFAEGYSMVVQCDRINAHILPRRDEFVGRTSAEVHRQAKAKGWVIDKREFTAFCKNCAITMRAERMT